jgi:antitoxin VapB
VSLYIRDPDVDALAGELMRRLGAKSKAEVVRQALENELERTATPVALNELITKYQQKVAAIGLSDPSYDHKTHMDEGWEM